MTLPYENATSGKRAIDDMQKILIAFGCNKFGHMLDIAAGELLVQFEYRGRQITVKASAQGYAQAWLKQHPYSSRMKSTRAQHEAKAKESGATATCSILRDVFPHGNVAPFYWDTKRWNAACKRAGIDHFRFHDIRHTWASWHVQGGTPLNRLMELGGWSSYEMVLRYAHLAPDHLKMHADVVLMNGNGEEGLQLVAVK